MWVLTLSFCSEPERLFMTSIHKHLTARHWSGSVSAPLLLAFCLFAGSANAQQTGGSGARFIKGYWIEPGQGLVIRPTQPFDNPTACTHAQYIWVTETNPQYRQILAAVIHAKATGLPIRAWLVSCKTYWGGESTPVVHALGADWD
jgi:hypothetical protein